MTISMMNINSFNIDSVKSTQKEDKNSKDSFADVMSLASGTVDNIDTKASDGLDKSYKPVEKVQKSEDSFADNTRQDRVKDNDSIDTDNKQYDKKVPDEKKDIIEDNTSTKAESTIEDSEDTDKIAKKLISGMIDKLMSFLTEQLGLSEDELQVKLGELGMDISDLLSSEGLKEFALYVNDANNVDMLIDEELTNDINSLEDMLTEITEEVNTELLEAGYEISEEEFKDIVGTLIAEADESENALGTKYIKADISGANNSLKNEKNIQNNANEVTENLLNDDNNVGNENELSGFGEESFSGMDKSFEHPEDNRIEIDFNNAVNQAFNNTEISELADMENVEPVDIVRQIIDDIRAEVTKDTTSLEVVLNPESLGKVTINVSEKDGAMQARIIAETEAAKNAIEASISNLKEAFNNQELKVDAIEVMVATYESFGQSEDNQNEEASANRTSGTNMLNTDDISEEELTEAEKLEVEMMRMAGNRVNYSI